MSRFSEAFLASPSSAQIASICRSHSARPLLTAAFVDAIGSGEIRIRLAPSCDRERRALRALGVRDDLVEVSGGCLTGLSRQFLAGSLHGQIEAVHRDRADRKKLNGFRLALEHRLVRAEPTSAVTGWHRKVLAKFGLLHLLQG